VAGAAVGGGVVGDHAPLVVAGQLNGVAPAACPDDDEQLTTPSKAITPTTVITPLATRRLPTLRTEPQR